MSRTLRAETRSRSGQVESSSKKSSKSLFKVRKWEKRWLSINDTTMKIHKWVPVIGEDQAKLTRHHPLLSDSSTSKENKQNTGDSSMIGEDSNTAFSTMSEGGQALPGATDFASARFNISDDSNSDSKK